MAQSNTITGARCIFKINGNVAGMFTDVSWSQSYAEQDLFVLGKYAAQDIVYTASNTVDVSATGYRAYSKGAFVVAELPKISDLALHNSITLEIEFDKEDKGILYVAGVRPLGYSSRVSARGVVEMSINFKGLYATDESIEQDGSVGNGNPLTVPTPNK